MFKKIALSVALVASVVASAATVMDLKGVNEAVIEILKPFNTQRTTAGITFTALEVDDVLTQHFGVKGLYATLGAKNALVFQIPKVEYKYKGADGLPTMDGKLELTLDMVKAFGKATLNDLGSGAEEFVKDFLKELTEEYGDAAQTDAAVDILERDQEGNVTRVKLHVSGVIDLTKLPQGKVAEEEFIIKGSGVLDVSLTKAELSLNLGFNPSYKGFKSDQQGLKEYIERLLNADKSAFDEVAEYVSFVDKVAKDVVEREAQQILK